VGLVHVHHSSYISFWRKAPVLAMAMLTRTPLVVSLHGGAFKDFYERLPRAARWWQRKIMRYAYRYLVLTKSWQDWASEVEPDARVEVIPNVVRRAPQPKPSYPDPADKPVLLFMGRVEALKGIRELVEALAMAYARGARWRLLMAGEGQIQQAIEDAHRLGLPSSAVECVGWVDEEMKDQLLRACSAVVLPSHVENMPVVLLEGFAYARPVVATCVGGIPDIVIDKKEGFLVPPRDAAGLSEALVALWNMSPSEKIEMGYAARRRYELLYSTTSVLTRLEEIYAIR
jgi:glycosyltransferase involved in cell wall biosynthesis